MHGQGCKGPPSPFQTPRLNTDLCGAGTARQGAHQEGEEPATAASPPGPSEHGSAARQAQRSPPPPAWDQNAKSCTFTSGSCLKTSISRDAAVRKGELFRWRKACLKPPLPPVRQANSAGARAGGDRSSGSECTVLTLCPLGGELGHACAHSPDATRRTRTASSRMTGQPGGRSGP